MKTDRLKYAKNILVTGGAGFIGGCFIRRLLNTSKKNIFNIDKCSYASDLNTIKQFEKNPRYKLLKVDLSNKDKLKEVFKDINPDLIVHFAAESHVDRSIESPNLFIESNVIGTFNLLELSLNYWQNLKEDKKKLFLFHHISTDEVFGSLGMEGHFNESTSYSPRSPYSASKASSDHFVNAWHHTYGLPTLITNCSNNFGPWQFPEKLIPLVILKALSKQPIPIYGNGLNIRDWLFVEDHIDALLLCDSFCKSGSNYCIGGFGEINNLDLVNLICKIIDKHLGDEFEHSSLISMVTDRPGHDFRYSINSSLIQSELGWRPKYDLLHNLNSTVNWYLNNNSWCEDQLKTSGYNANRLGL